MLNNHLGLGFKNPMISDYEVGAWFWLHDLPRYMIQFSSKNATGIFMLLD
jgi:hypothetical protein